MLIMALQYQILKDTEAAGTQLVISDSPLRLNLLYARELTWYQPFAALVRGLRLEFKEIDVLLKRAVPYQTHCRVQGSEEEARRVDEQLTGPFDVSIDSPAPGEVINRLDPLVLPVLGGAR
jgi:hypothetical protein